MEIEKASWMKRDCFIILGVIGLFLIGVLCRSLFSPKAPQYLYLCPKNSSGKSQICRFERGVEEPVILHLEGIHAPVADFCVLNQKLYLLCRNNDFTWYVEECDANGTFLRTVADSSQVSEPKSLIWMMWTDGTDLYLLQKRELNGITTEEQIADYPRTEDGRVYDAANRYLCLNVKTGTIQPTFLYANYDYKQGIGKEKGFSYASSYLWQEDTDGLITTGLAFYSYDQKKKQGTVFPIDEKLLETYGYPGREGYYYCWYQDGRTLYANFLNADGELELFAITVQKGEIKSCRLIKEATGCAIQFAEAGHVLLAGVDGWYEYKEGKGRTPSEWIPLELPHWKRVHEMIFYWSEDGYAGATDYMAEDNGTKILLPEGEENCFLHWYEDETEQEYLLKADGTVKRNFIEWDKLE